MPRVFSFILFFLLLSLAQAQYVQRYSTITNGAVTFTGNTLGLSGSGTYTAPGTNHSVGAFSTTANTTFGTYPVNTTNSAGASSNTAYLQNSASAVLTLPAGSSVLYAELVWGGSYNNSNSIPVASLNNAVTFITPSGSYNVSPDPVTAKTPGRYVRSQNVTGLVQIAGAGTYTVGKVPGTANTEATANTVGWTLAVIYSNPSLPERNLTLFVGAEAGGADPAGVSGFCTPLTGLAKGRVLVTAMEGDASLTGDQMKFGPSVGSAVALSGPNNPINNFFGSQINGDNGSLSTTGTHGLRNHDAFAGTNISAGRQGWDITNVDVTAALTNGQNSAVAQGTTTGDQYTISALALQIDVGSPNFPITVKTVDKTQTYVGDTLTYRIDLINVGGDTVDATNVVFTDALPPGLSFVPGTVTVDGTVQPSFDPLLGFNVGTVASGATRTVRFQARVDSLPASPAAAQYGNSASWTYQYVPCAGEPVQNGLITTNAVITPAPRLEPRKSVSPTGTVSAGQTLTYTITIPNTGIVNTSGTTLQDSIPVGTTYLPGSTRLNSGVVPDVSGAMPYTTTRTINTPGEPPGQLNVGESATVTFQVTATGATTEVRNIAVVDQDGVGPAPSQTAQAVSTALAAPSVSKAFNPTTIGEGGVSQLTVTLTNANGTPLTNASITDTLPSGVSIANPANVSTTCGGTASAMSGGITLALTGGTIPATGSCLLRANVTAANSGSYVNQLPVGSLVTDGGSNILTASATLTVTEPPLLSKSISPGTIVPGGSAQLTLTLTNSTATAMTAASLTDIFPTTPGAMTLFNTTTTNTCGGSLTDSSGGALNVGDVGIRLTGGTIPALNNCTITANVTATVTGTYTNTIPAGGLTSSGGSNVTPAIATLVLPRPLISKSFSPNPVARNTNTTLTITLSNLTATALTGAVFTDVFPTTPGAMTYQSTTSNSCGGTLTDSAGGGLATGDVGIRLTGGTIPASSTCSVVVVVQASAAGSYTNVIPSISTTNGGTNSTGTSAVLSVAQPSVSKTFGTFASPIITIPTTTSVPLTIQLSNPTSTAITGVTFNDIFPTTPGAMTLASTTITTNTCGGTITDSSGTSLNVGDVGIRLTGGSIPAAGCTITVNVTAPVSGVYSNIIPAGAVTTTSSGGNVAPASAIITVLDRPTISKSFSPNPVSSGAISTLTITLTNTNAYNLTGATFTDVFPTTPGAMTLANTTTTNTCGGTLNDSGGASLNAGDVGVQLSGGTIAGSSSCVIAVNVTASTTGTYTNTIAAGSLTTTNGGSNTSPATAPLSVQILPPTFSKSFSPNPAPSVTTDITLTFTITNPNATATLTGVAFTDSFPPIPGLMVVAPTPTPTTSGCGSPTFAPASGSGSINFSNGTLLAGATCTVSVKVRAPVAGTYTNISNPVTSTNGGTGTDATAAVTVLSPPAISKSFSINPVPVNTPTVLTITVSNPNSSAPLTGVAVNDVYPAGLLNTATPSPALNCSPGSSGIFTGGAAGGNSVGMIGGTLLAGGVCTITVNVSSANDGSYLNTTGAVTSNEATGGVAGAEVLYVSTPPAMTKAFGVSGLEQGATTTLTLTITNANTNLAYNNLAVTDNFPSGLQVAATPGLTNSCGGTISPGGSPGNTSLVLTGGTLAAGVSCQIQVNVIATAAGVLTNTTNPVSSSTGGTGNSANANLSVVALKLGAAKALDRIIHNNTVTDNTYTLVYRLTVENFSSVTLSNLELFDDVVTLFSGLAPTNYNIWVNANAALLSPAPTLSLNSSWNGTASSNILTTGQSLAGGSSGLVYISFEVTVNPLAASPNNTLRDNSATVRGSSPTATMVSDASSNGLDPDGSDNDNNPDETSVTPAPFVKLVKEVRNCGNSLATCIGVFGVSASGKPGDYLEYQIHYYNLSSQAITTLVVKDTLVNTTPFQEDTYGLISPNVADFRVTCPNSSTIDIDRSNAAVMPTPSSGTITAFEVDVTATSVCNLPTIAPGQQGQVLFKVKIP